MKKVRLSNCCEIIGGYAFDSKKMSTKEGTFQVIKMGNVYNGILDLSRNTSYISNPTNNELVSLLKEKDIIITLTGTVNKKDYGYSVQIENQKNLLLNQRCALIRATNINDEYLFYLIKSKHFLDQFYSSSTGGTGNQTNVSIKAMEQFKVSIHSEEEQEKIAYLLKKIDIRISTQIKIIEEYKRLKKSISEALFKNLDSTKTFFKNIYEKAKEGGTPSTNCEAYYDGDIPFIKIDDLNNKYITENKYFISELGLQNSSAWVIPTNSIILSNGATIGSVSINVYPVTTKQGVLGIVPNKNISTEYLYYLINTTDFKRKLKAITTKGTIDCAYIKDIDFIKIKIHDEKNQKKIADILSKIDKKILVESSILNNLINQKKYLLNNLFI